MKAKLRRIVCLIALAIFLAVPAAGAPIKYSLSVFHFNIQYVIGGLYGFIPLPNADWPYWEISPDDAEDMIIRESFAPILDLLDQHPDWTLTLELQAYFIEVLAERHPEVLNQLRELVDAGGVELVSFHYSDQFFIAYPYEDWEKSNDRVQQVMEDNGLTLSGAVFCQEGQAAEGMARRMAERGYSVMAWPKNLWGFQHGEYDAEPYYTFGDVLMVIAGKGVSDDANEVYVDWSFMGDGELLATGDLDPYFPWFFKYRPAAVKEYEEELAARVAEGYIIGGIEDYVRALQDAGISPATPPPLLDGTWQPDSTTGSSLWMGRGGLWRKDERDNNVRTLAYQAHREIKAAETIAAAASLDRTAVLDEAWRQLHHGQVSDGTGLNPYRGEVEFCLAANAEALRIAREVIDEAKTELGLTEVLINTATGEVTAGEYVAPTESLETAPLAASVQALDRTFQRKWYRISDDPLVYRLEVFFSDSLNKKAREISVTFPFSGEEILTTTALIDDEIRAYSFDDFAFAYYYLPAPIGLIGLGNDWWVIKDTGTVHVAAYVEPHADSLRFEDLTAPWFETIPWVFYVMQGTETEALEFADRINVHPTLAR